MKPHQLRRALKRNPNQCPHCGSKVIVAGPIIEEDPATLARHIECVAPGKHGCGGTWYERYTLADATWTD